MSPGVLALWILDALWGRLVSSGYSSSFLAAAARGRSRWKHYAIGLLTVVAGSVAGLLAMLLLAFLGSWRSGLDPDALSIAFETDVNLMLALAIAALGWVVGSLYVAIARVHRRKFLTLVSADASIRWRRVAFGFLVGLGLWVANVAIFAVLSPDRYVWFFDGTVWRSKIAWATCFWVAGSVTSVLLWAYVLQALGSLVKNPVLLSVVWGAIAGILAIASGGGLRVENFLLAFFGNWLLVWIVLKEDRLEPIAGLFAASLFVGLFLVAIEPGADGIASAVNLGVLKLADPEPDAIGIFGVAIREVVFYLACFGWKNNPFSLQSDRR